MLRRHRFGWSYEFFVRGERVGQVQLTRRGGIFGVEIDEARRGKGYGRKLMREILTLARRRKMPDVWLWVYQDNERALSLYLSLGFVRIRTLMGLRGPAREMQHILWDGGADAASVGSGLRA